MIATIDLEALKRAADVMPDRHVQVSQPTLAALINAVHAALRIHTDCTWDELEQTLAPFRTEETSTE